MMLVAFKSVPRTRYCLSSKRWQADHPVRPAGVRSGTYAPRRTIKLKDFAHLRAGRGLGSVWIIDRSIIPAPRLETMDAGLSPRRLGLTRVHDVGLSVSLHFAC